MLSFEYSKFLNYFYSKSDLVKVAAKELWGSFFIKAYLISSFFLNMLCWVFVYVMEKMAGDGLVVLHYNVNFGADLIGQARKIYIIPFFGLIIIVLNLFMVNVFHKHNKFLEHLLLATLTIVHIFLLFSLALIYLINFR